MIDPIDPRSAPELFLRIYVTDRVDDERSRTDLGGPDTTSLDTTHPAFGPSSGWDMAFEEFEQLVEPASYCGGRGLPYSSVDDDLGLMHFSTPYSDFK